MGRIEEMIYMAVSVVFFVVAVNLLMYTGRCSDRLFEAYQHLEVPQEMISDE